MGLSLRPGQTGRELVAERAPAGLAAFDAKLAAGVGEDDAAFEVARQHGALEVLP